VKRSIAVAASAIAVIAAVGVVAALGLAAAPTSSLRLPPDRVYDKSKDSPGPVVFSHKSHVEIADNKCTGCHPAPFKMLHPAGRMTHDELNAGRLCGACHDGKTASGVEESCEHCHLAPQPATDAAKVSKGGGA
jgi:c(7)-type cytochrome triheme protein